jgi:zona occludens toxin
MAINCYNGLMGTGKSYEVVSSVIVPAVAAGRRVVSNIRGLNNDLVRAYCVEKLEVPLDELGCIVNVTDEDIASPDFFPDHEAAEGAESSALVKPGDLVAVDEAYKIWGGDCKIHNKHKVFFREHRHYTHPDTGVSCDLVLMTQDITDLHRMIKNVIGQSFKTHKAKGIGRDDLYTVTMWEGWKQPAKHIVKDWTKTYDPVYFPLYKSYSGSKQGKELNADSRTNILGDRSTRTKVIVFVLIACFILWRLFNAWWGKTHPDEDKSAAAVASSSSPTGSPATPASVPKKAAADLSGEYRVMGTMRVNDLPYIVLSGPTGVRVELAAGFSGVGFDLHGVVDGSRVTRFSGAPVTRTEKQK